RDGSGPGGDPCRGPPGGGDPGPAHDRLAERGRGLRRHRVHISPGRRAPASSAHGRVAIELLRRSWAPAPIPLDAPDHLDARASARPHLAHSTSDPASRHHPSPLLINSPRVPAERDVSLVWPKVAPRRPAADHTALLRPSPRAHPRQDLALAIAALVPSLGAV